MSQDKQSSRSLKDSKPANINVGSELPKPKECFEDMCKGTQSDQVSAKWTRIGVVSGIVFEALTLIGLIVTICLLNSQNGAIRADLNLTKSRMASETRPWVFIDNNHTKGAIQFAMQSGPILMRINDTLKNYGQFPAKNIIRTMRCGSETSVYDLFLNWKNGGERWVSGSSDAGILLLPGERVGLSVIEDTINNPTAVGKIIVGACATRIGYRDQLDSSHRFVIYRTFKVNTNRRVFDFQIAHSFSK